MDRRMGRQKSVRVNCGKWIIKRSTYTLYVGFHVHVLKLQGAQYVCSVGLIVCLLWTSVLCWKTALGNNCETFTQRWRAHTMKLWHNCDVCVYSCHVRLDHENKFFTKPHSKDSLDSKILSNFLKGHCIN